MPWVERNCATRAALQLLPSPDGHAVHQTLQRQARRLSKVAVTGFSAEERRQLVALLRRVRTNLERAS
jgi:DNA-binding MarR family transcriptional regulator